MPACALAFVVALAAHVIDWRGLVALLAFGANCIVARRPAPRAVSVAVHASLLLMCAALFLHAVPGFDNPRVITNAVLAPDSEPYTKYLNFDKGVAALFLLGLYAPELTARDEGARHVTAFAWQFAVLAVVAMVLAMALGYVRWDPKLPSWWGTWMWSMLFLTALPEETLFRGIAQTALNSWLAGTRFGTALAIVAAGGLFGVAHIAGGPAYVVLATVAGIGYGWIYASTRSIGAAVLAHAGLNTLHFLLFSYPALRMLTAPWVAY
jgi:membrane protease YdiL (CAAX protease family)